MDKKNKELRVGIFIIIAVVSFTIIVFSIGDVYLFFEKGYNIKVMFGFINGLEPAAPVRLAGMTVGEVQDIDIYYDETSGRDQVEVSIWLKKDIKLRQDAEIYINMLGMLGEKYIEIFSSGSRQARLLKEGDEIVGYDPIPIEKLTRISQENLIALHGILGSSETKTSIKDILSNTRDLTRDLKEIIAGIKAGKGTIGRLVVDDELYQNLEDLSKDIKAHPWRLLRREKTKTSTDEKTSGPRKPMRRSR